MQNFLKNVCPVLFLFFNYVNSQACCPEGAWGELKNPDYQDLGQVEEIKEDISALEPELIKPSMDIYKIGNSTKCVIWNYDIFGFDSGRTRQMADFIAAHGYLVVIPDYYRGTFDDLSDPTKTVQFLKDQSQWFNRDIYQTESVPPIGRLQLDFLNVLEYLKNQGCKTIGTIGTCWGTYPVIRMSEHVDIKAGISMHPSHPGIMNRLLEDEENILKEVKSPQMFLPSQSDPASVKLNGLGKQVLGDGVEIIEFPDMRHGWTVRGDLADPAIERDVKKAFNLVLAFFGKYL